MTRQAYTQTAIPALEDLGQELDTYMPPTASTDSFLARREELKFAIQSAKDELAEIDLALGTASDLSGIKSYLWRDYVVMRKEGGKGRPSLDRVLLLEAGVTPEQLAKGTKYGKPTKPCISMRRVGEKENDE